MLPLLIIALALAVTGLIAEFASNYHTQVRLIRKFFRIKDVTVNEYIKQTALNNNIDYMSAFPGGTLDIYTSNSATEPQPVLLWVHGGGYVGGDKTCIVPWAHETAAKLKIAVISMNYCLAPEHHYPVPLLQICEALRFLKNHESEYNLDTARIFIGGDSAGAQLTAQFAALVCNKELQTRMKITPPISASDLRGILLCCGFYNMDTVMKSHFPAMKTFLWAYTNKKKIGNFDKKDDMSAIKYVNSDFCSVYLTCGNADPFIDQAHEMSEILRAANISREIYLPAPKGKKLGHEYQFDTTTEEGKIALDKAVNFIAARL